MTRSIQTATLGVLLLALSAFAAAPPPPPPPPFANREPDQLDYLYLGSDRPTLIRVHLRAGDKPYAAAWEAYMDKLFAWFDKDNNGTIDAKESARVVPADVLQRMSYGGIGGRGRNQTVPFAQLDTNKDGKVSMEEFRAYYSRSGMGAVRFTYDDSKAKTAKQVNNAISRRVSRPSGKLTKDDITKLERLLPKLDADEDESLTATEINTDGEGESMYGYVVPVAMPAMSPKSEAGLTEIQPTTTAAALAAQVIAHYDANRDGKLAAGERGLDKAFVEEFDADKDGRLSAKEIEAFFRRGPDVELRVRVGALGVGGLLGRTGLFGKAGRTEVVNRAKMPAALAKKVKKLDGDNVSLELGDARFNVQANEGQSYGRFGGAKRFYLMQFDTLDPDKKGYVERKGNENDFYVIPQFTYADKNADGKLTKKEFGEWLDLGGDIANAFVTVQVNDLGRSLFEVMDANGDAKLSVRELRAGWSRLEPFAKGGKVSQADLPRTLHVKLIQGMDDGRRGFIVFAQPTGTPGPAPVKGNPPAWFTKMDINGDGDVSLKEWLGDEETFHEIDADKDGLISVAEARAHEAKKGVKDATKEPAKKEPAKK